MAENSTKIANLQKISANNFFLWADEEVYEGKKYNGHFHNFCQTVFVYNGILKYSVSNKIVTLKKGDFLIIPPGEFHSPVPNQNPADFNSIEMKFYITNGINSLLLNEKHSEIINVRSININQFLNSIRSILKEWRAKNSGFQKAIYCQIDYLFLLLQREKTELPSNIDNESENNVSLSENRKIKIYTKVKDYIDQNYMKDISFGDLANSMYISLSYMSELFKSKNGLSPVEYLNTIRLDKSKELIKTSELNFSQISEKVGYHSVYYFSRIFKKINSVTPSRYKAVLEQDKKTIVRATVR